MTRASDRRRSVLRLAILIYPFVAAAMAINIFLLGLMGQAIGFRVFTPVISLGLGMATGIPAAWFAGMWVRVLIERGEEE